MSEDIYTKFGIDKSRLKIIFEKHTNKKGSRRGRALTHDFNINER